MNIYKYTLEIIGTDERSKLVYISQKICCVPFFWPHWHDIGRFPFQGTTCCAGHGFAAHPGFPGGAAPLPPHQDLGPTGWGNSCPGIRGLNAWKPAAGDPTAGGLVIDSSFHFVMIFGCQLLVFAGGYVVFWWAYSMGGWIGKDLDPTDWNRRIVFNTWEGLTKSKLLELVQKIRVRGTWNHEELQGEYHPIHQCIMVQVVFPGTLDMRGTASNVRMIEWNGDCIENLWKTWENRIQNTALPSISWIIPSKHLMLSQGTVGSSAVA